MQDDDENPSQYDHRLMKVRHLIRDSCTHRRAAVVSRSPINLENNWGNIFSSKGEPRRRRREGRGSKYFEWSSSFNDMQQMWNEAEARGNHSTDLTGCVAANTKKAARQNQTDNSGLSS